MIFNSILIKNLIIIRKTFYLYFKKFRKSYKFNFEDISQTLLLRNLL